VTSIARNLETQGDLIDWWDEEELDDTVDVSVGAGEVVLFVRLVELKPGRHRLTAESHPVLADWLRNDDEDVAIAFMSVGQRVEVDVAIGYTWDERDEAFVATTGTIVVKDGALAFGLLEHLDDEESLEDWIGDEIATHLADAIGALDVPDILHVTSQARDADVIEDAMKRANEVLGTYGVKVEKLDELTHQLDPETEKRIKAELVKKARA
jgi:hypothetical protein